MVPHTVEVITCVFVFVEAAAGDIMDNPGYHRSGSSLDQHPSSDDDDQMVDIAGATLDFSSTDDVPPLSSGKLHETNTLQEKNLMEQKRWTPTLSGFGEEV